MKFFATALLSASLFCSVPAAVDAGQLIAKVDVSKQVMRAYKKRQGNSQMAGLDGTQKQIQTARSTAWQVFSRHHKSSLYKNAPMPYSIFYSGNFAIQGTNKAKRLGRPASAGCIRLDTSNAKKLFAMPEQVETRNLKVIVQN